MRNLGSELRKCMLIVFSLAQFNNKLIHNSEQVD